MNIIVRIATSSDVPVITKLYNSDTNLFGENETGYGEEDILEYISDNRKKMFLCIIQDEVIGALLAEYHDTYVYLDTLIVSNEYQGKGIGKVLMDAFEKDVKSQNISLIESLTEINNERMKKFFESREYKKGNTFIFYSKRI